MKTITITLEFDEDRITRIDVDAGGLYITDYINEQITEAIT